MINPVHLRTLIEVVRLGSFASAANRLGYTPSAVSQQMSALEADSGVRLFERTGRSVLPTEAARITAQRAAVLLSDLDELLNAAADASADTQGELRLSIYASLAHFLLPDFLEAQLADEPHLGIRLSVRDPSAAIQALRMGEEVDVSLVYRVGESGLSWPNSVTPSYLGEDAYRFVVPQSWGLHGKGAVETRQLVGRAWIQHFSGSSDLAEIDSVFAAHELRPRIVARSDDYAVDLELISSGYAGSFVPEAMLSRLPQGVEVLDVPGVSLSRSIWALVSNRAPRRPTERLMRRLRNALERRPPGLLLADPPLAR